MNNYWREYYLTDAEKEWVKQFIEALPEPETTIESTGDGTNVFHDLIKELDSDVETC